MMFGAILNFVASLWSLGGLGILASGALGALAFFLPAPLVRLRKVALVAAIAVGAVTAGYWKGHSDASEACQTAELQQQVSARDAKIAQLEARVRVASESAINDQQRAIEAEAARAQAEENAREIANRIPDSVCLSDDSADELRKAWKPAPGRRRR